MNNLNPKFLHWSNLVNMPSHFFYKLFAPAIISILIINFPESIAAQTELPNLPENGLEIVSFDWFIGQNWETTNEFLNNSWKNLSFGNKQLADFQSVVKENGKFLNNQKEGFIYQLTVRNNSTQKISTLSWEYVFKNPLNGETLETHLFICRQQIKPNEKKVLFVFSENPPTNVISIELLLRNSQKPYLESAIIKSVVFSEINKKKILVDKLP